MSEIRKKTIGGVIWNLTERLGNQLIRFVLGVILARLLTPSDYGLIALTTIIISSSEIITDGGFLMSLVQRGKNTKKEYSTIFWLKILTSLGLYSLIFFLSDHISQFFNEPELSNILKVISLVIVLSSLSGIHRIILMNQLDFKGQTKVILASTIIGGVVGIILAFNGYGVWSLVYQTLIIHTVQILFFWIYTKWIPHIYFSKSFLKEISKMSSFFLFNNLLNVFYSNLYILFLGKFYSTSTLGLYTRARQFEQLPENTTNSIIVKVFFPILSKIKGNLTELRENTITILMWLSFIVTPLMLLLILNSEQIIVLLLTDKWIEATIYLQILGVAGIFIPLNNTLLNILNVLGKPKYTTIILFFKIIFSSFLIFLVLNQDPIWVVSILIIENIIVLFLAFLFTRNEIDLKFMDAVKRTGTIYISNATSFLICFFMLPLVFGELSNVFHLLLYSLSFILLTYLQLNFLKAKPMMEVNGYLKKLIFSR